MANLKKLSEYANKYLILLLPFEEYSRIDEHFYTFDSNNIPVAFDDWVLVHLGTIDASTIQPNYWNGKQVLLVFSRLAELNKTNLSIGDYSFYKSQFQLEKTLDAIALFEKESKKNQTLLNASLKKKRRLKKKIYSYEIIWKRSTRNRLIRLRTLKM